MKTFVFGHKTPDTDTVTSAIALSYLENCLGNNTEPRVLGDVNQETKFALNHFNVSIPEYLNDVKLQLRDVNYHKGFMISEVSSIYQGYQKMLDKELNAIPVVKDDKTFIGLINIKDLAISIFSNKKNINTSYKNILDTLSGVEILKFDDEISGELVVATCRSKTFFKTAELDDKILIVGDRNSLIEYAVNNKPKLIIVTNEGSIKDEYLSNAKNNSINIIKTNLDTYEVIRLISLSNYIKTMITNYNPAKFCDSDYIEDVLEKNKKLKHTTYPVVNKHNKCLGLLKITDISDSNPKKVILVDHNEKIQSADGIDEAEILEIVDHHNLGNITTKKPINFRNMSVGSTCTIVYTLFIEKMIDIPKEIAGCLLSGILSDTLILRSPTTTELDKNAVDKLSSILEIDYQKYGIELVSARTSLKGMSVLDVLYNDFKLYNISNKSIGIGQVFTMDFDEIKNSIDKYVEVLDKVVADKEYNFLALYVTDIINNGSYIIYSSKSYEKIALMYDDIDIYEGCFIKNTISRKKDILPLIMEIYE